ncbi:MAG: Phosphoglucomutase [Elusimicrobia bacterium ADurb.Bin231]|nr:MAG: Phosphoglucomutase [Elusimicrobia bacterium ADurb.Bin231]
MAETNKFDIKFGTDGWRGVISRDFTFTNVRVVSQAVADYIKTRSGRVYGTGAIVGFDNRFLSREFAFAVAQTLLANGIYTKISSSAVTSPSISYFSKKYKLYGVMITASHNPPSWNGIKIKLSYGGSVSEEVISGIYSLIGKSSVKHSGDMPFEADVLGIYERYLLKMTNLPRRSGITAVVDSMFGSGLGIFNRIIKTGIHSIHNYRDPLFGGINPEPIESNLSGLKQEVLKQKADVGFAFDGDADRIGLVDDKGRYLSPHIVFPLILLYLIEQRKLFGKVVQTISLGYLSERIAKHYSLPFEEVPVGFKYVCPRMIKEDVLIGGEESGGYGWKGGIPERDGILNALLIYEMLSKSGKKLSSLVQEMQKKFGKSVFKRKDIKLSAPIDKKEFTIAVKRHALKLANIKEIKDYDGLKIVFRDDSWLLLRPSGTEPVLRTYSETDSTERTDKLLKFAFEVVKKYV